MDIIESDKSPKVGIRPFCGERERHTHTFLQALKEANCRVVPAFEEALGQGAVGSLQDPQMAAIPSQSKSEPSSSSHRGIDSANNLSVLGSESFSA